MKNFFSFMNSHQLANESSAGEISEIVWQGQTVDSDLIQNRIVFSDFDDWLYIAAKGAVVSPYAFSWRRLALQYPKTLAIKTLPALLDIVRRKPILADQARAIIFSIPSERLPETENLQDLAVNNNEQMRIKQLLIKKKIFGDEVFVSEFLADVISSRADGQVCFLIEGGREVRQKSDVLTAGKKKRFSTIFGMATMISIQQKYFEETGIVRQFFFLVDGDACACKMREIEFCKIVTFGQN